MEIHGVDHVEFYVGDAQQAAFYLCTAFGFRVAGQGGPETGLDGQRTILLRQGQVQVLLTTGLDARHPAAEYVGRHGDGVGVIAFGVDDAAEAFATLVSRGAEAVEPVRTEQQGENAVTTAMVSGFGDVTHRLVQRVGDTEEFLPGLIELIAPDIEEGEHLFSIVDHAAVLVPGGELTRTVEYYQEVFGFSQIFQEFIEVGEQAMDSKVVQSPSGGVTFTIIEPVTDRRPGQIDGFLGRHGGAGVQHLALLTDDIVSAVRVLERRGVRFLETPGSYYDELENRLGVPELDIKDLRDTNVLVDRDHWGQVFQIFAQSMHVRNTYFFEVIDRHGAKTFGSGNVKALYEAVDREKTTT
ncbi:4-hydroxyphenylpyruvate dioxygenase [Kitasatospora viridis]|uniref:4-hydroxymandelate synthase n=1 Tax=Kitasatospora viridis TaxID=281105 RepID=A0A561UIT9_9ACTN|nr:4-hydroxyphenylpyruvate dioxygenase [Kitasatospora viridis]TWF99257.1 4-hydroxymandelate synthase [Kitasatospora viridis]